MKSEIKPPLLFIALTFIFTLLWLFPLQFIYAAQTKGFNIGIKDRTGRKIMLYKESHALLIGAGKYNKGWPKLESVPGEVRKIEQALKQNGFQVHTVMDPTSKELEYAFTGFIDRYGFKKDNRLLFFYSGHGYSRKSPLQGYLVPVDAPDPRISRSGFLRKALSMSQILTWCREMEAKHVLFLFDSCFSGTIFKTRDLQEHPPHISDIASRPVRQFITAGAAGEPVPAKSVFAPSFIRALRGEGDVDKDGYVTGTELGMYMHKKVLGYETGQTPQYGKIKDPDLDEGDFVFMVASSGAVIDGPSKTPTISFLSVESNISGATVLVDGKKIGTTPIADMPILPGKHIIKVEKDGYQSYIKRITVTKGRSAALPVILDSSVPKKGRLFVDTEPRGARVRVLNIAPKFHQGIELDAGRYHVEVSHQGYETKKMWISLVAGEDKTLDIRIKAVMGTAPAQGAVTPAKTFIGFGSGAPAANLGTKDEVIKLAINEWTGQHITTHVAGEILKRMGYKVDFITAGYYPQMQALVDGTLAASLEIWDNNIGEHYNKAMATGKVLNLGGLGLDANEGWAYPVHVEKLCPGLPDWKALEKCVDVFATPETLPKGRILAYPADWGHRSADIIKGLNIPYKAMPAGSEGAIVSELKSSQARKSPLITMVWGPHRVFAEVAVKWVKLPPGEKACYEDPAWGPNPNAVNDCGVAKPNIFKVAWIGMKKKWPAAHRFLELFQMADTEQIPMMAAIDSRNEKLSEVTKAWVDANQSKWQPWVDAALKGN